MTSAEYVTGREVDPADAGSGQGNEAAVGEAHAVLVEAAKGDGPFHAECGKRVDVIRGGPWPPGGPGAAGPCPVCARLTGA